MSANIDPIYSRVGSIDWTAVVTAAATSDYLGVNNANVVVFEADDNNGGFLQKLRFKATTGTNNTATVARIYINSGLSNQSLIGAPGQPAGSTGTAGRLSSTYTQYAKCVAIGEGGDVSAVSTESAGVTTAAGLNGSVLWSWTAPANHYVAAYKLYVGMATGVQNEYFAVPYSVITASTSGASTTMTVAYAASTDTIPDTRICSALRPGTVFATGGGLTAGDYIIKQLTSTETDGSLGRNGTYLISTARTVSGQVTTNPLNYQQITPVFSMVQSSDGQPAEQNQVLYGEVSLPAVTASATAATADIDYPMNIALPPGYEIYVGLPTSPTGGWSVIAVAGKF